MRRPRPRRRRQYYRFSWAKPYVIRLKHFHGCNFRFRLGFRIQGGLAVHHVLLFPPFFMLAHSIEFNKNIYVPRYFAKSLRNKIHTSQKNTLKSQGKKQNNIQDSNLSRIVLKLDHWCSRGYKFIAILLKNMYWLSDSIYILLKNIYRQIVYCFRPLFIVNNDNGDKTQHDANATRASYATIIRAFKLFRCSSPPSPPTLFESENERQKIEPVPIPLPRASRNFPDVKSWNDFFFS